MADSAPGRDTKILYVEDDEGLARLLQKRLARLGFAVEIAGSGEQALEKFQPGGYDAVLLDYTLPQMDGLEVLRRLKPVNGEPPVIMLTAGGSEMLALEALQLGAEDYIAKDINQTYIDLLPHVINAALIKLSLRKQNAQQQGELHYYVAELEKRNTELTEEIRERRELEGRLREAKDKAEAANIAKSEFLANMSHEIRTPMNAVIGLANILAMSAPLTDRQREFIGTLQMSADALLSLINDLLDISRIEARSMELEQIPFSMSQVMQEIISMMSVRTKEKGLNFMLHDTSVRGLTFIGDPNRLRQIVLNLSSNAVKFTESGGISITISNLPGKDAATRLIEITVADTGIGIAEAKRETIFEKFVQADSSINRKYGGTGLGLAITKTLTEIMDGTISVASTPGKGSAFTVRLPLPVVSDGTRDKTAALNAEPALPVQPEEKHCILIVEDYAPNVMVASSFLDQFGYCYEVASTGAEAIAKIKAKPYAAALMDVQMHAMNGLEATRLIREHEQQHNLPRMPIIGMTAHVLRGDRERCLAAGMDDYVSKPFNPDEFREKLKAYMPKNQT